MQQQIMAALVAPGVLELEHIGCAGDSIIMVEWHLAPVWVSVRPDRTVYFAMTMSSKNG